MLCFIRPRGVSPLPADLLGDAVNLGVSGLSLEALDIVVVVRLILILVNSEAKFLPEPLSEILPRLGLRFRS